MIRQLHRLLRPVGEEPGGPVAPAVYAHRLGAGWHHRPAADQGYEGVACLDDAARAAVLCCAIWRRDGLGWARTLALRLLAFVTFMQRPDGRFGNFILDWAGQPNLTGPSSAPGGPWWTARAMRALAAGIATFTAPEVVGPWSAAYRAGLPWLDQPMPLDTRACGVLAVLDHDRGRALAWCEEIAAARLGDRLPDMPGEPDVHLWGHLQEAALALAGRRFDRPDLVRIARASAEEVLVPVVASGFRRRTTVPYDVSSAVAVLSTLAAVTGERRYARLAGLARAWFDGRNSAGVPVYDRVHGLVHDGIDDGRLNPDSGAESNIEAALALMPPR